MKFIDTARIRVRGGDGGAGCVSFRREKFVPKGGPDGGNGGRGGNVVLRGNRQLATLLDFRYRTVYRAERGQHGMGSRKTGSSGDHTVLEVPLGTLVREAHTHRLLGELLLHGQTLTVAEGGRGGRGNAEFATATNQAPRRYEVGRPGEEHEIELELKLLADVGLVGLPNAGKSTLISTVSAARPKIADYPFTTLVPNLGIVRIEPGKSFVVADIPGLIEGAHDGKGLGHQFLRHIERTSVLAFLLDATRQQLREDYQVLTKELRLFNRSLLSKPRVVVLTKMDALDDALRRRLARTRFGSSPVVAISAVSGDGVPDLIRLLWGVVSSARARQE